MNITITTAMDNQTTFVSGAIFQNQLVYLSSFEAESLHCCHDVVVVHHYDDQGRHYCPTGAVMCNLCGAVGTEPEPNSCEKWGEL